MMNLLIDGSSLLWRTHYANVSQKRASVNNNIFGFLRAVKSYATKYNTKDIYIAWDKKLNNEKSFRQIETEGEYKGQRDKAQAEIVYEAQPKIAYATGLLGCKNLQPGSMEADDIIAWLSHTLEGYNVIITTDGDMLQLIDEKTCVFDPRKKITIDKNNFESKMKMPIDHFLPYKAILGDTSDNISGIDGYGPVKSKKLAKEWVEDKDSISEEKTQIIEKNIRLMDLHNGYKEYGTRESDCFQDQLTQLNSLGVDMNLFKEFCEEHNFKSILFKFREWENIFDTPYLFDILS